jgi:hypothetical protein
MGVPAAFREQSSAGPASIWPDPKLVKFTLHRGGADKFKGHAETVPLVSPV